MFFGELFHAKNISEVRYSDRDPDIIADSCESLLSDGDVIKKLAELKARDEGLFEKIKSFITKLVARIKKAYAGMKPDSYEGRIVSEMVDEGERLKELFVDALLDASEARASGAKVESEISDVRYDDRNKSVVHYENAIDQIDNGTLDIQQNTHLKVLEHTPQIYIDKAGASNCEIVMSWDVAYLAMKKSGEIPGNYHGLGADVMKSIPHALEDPLFIVKQKNGRIAAVTKIVVKGKRAVFASIELDAFKTTTQKGKTEAKKYNLLVTVTDAKPNYLQNTIFNGEIVHNKNNEDPAHFILRLKSLEKAVPTYDLAESSDSSISQSAKKSNTFDEKNSGIKFSDRDPDIIADSCESLLSDGDVIKKLAELKARDEGLFEKIKSFITKLVARIKKAYAGMKPDSYEGRIVSEMVDEGERLKQLFADALLDASEARASGAKIENAGSDVMYSERYQEAEINQDILSMVAKVDSGNFRANDKIYLGTVADSTAGEIYNITGINVTGFKVAIEARQIEHIIKRHGKSGKADRTMADSTDIAKMGYTLENYDKISPAEKTKAYKQFIDGKSVWSDTVLYEKEIGDKSYYVVQAVPDTKAKTLYIVTAFIGKKGYKKEVSQFIDEKIPDATPKSEIAIASSGSISQKDANVNNQYKEISENISENKFSDRDPIDIEQYKKVNRQLEKENAELKEDVDDVEDDSPYSYDSLISKKDMPITVLPKTVPDNRADVVYYAKQNAAKIGKFNAKDGSVSVHVDDIDTDVILGTSGLKHGLDRRFAENAAVTVKAGEIIKNSIKLNELTPKKAEAKDSYVLMGAASNENGDLHIITFVVNKFSNELTSMDVLYAINAKKESRLRSMRPGIQPPVTDSAISIAQLLELVNRYFPDILPESVLRHFGYDSRPDGVLGNSVLYSDRDSESFSSRSLLANALESAAKEGEERELLKKYQTNISELDKKHAELSEIRERANKIRYTKGRTAEQTQKSEAENSYIPIGVAKNANGDLYIFRSVLNHFNKYF